jgi:hypothetical protein
VGADCDADQGSPALDANGRVRSPRVSAGGGATRSRPTSALTAPRMAAIDEDAGRLALIFAKGGLRREGR